MWMIACCSYCTKMKFSTYKLFNMLVFIIFCYMKYVTNIQFAPIKKIK